MSEHSDCLSLMVSEENGTMSYAINGKLSRFVGERGIERILTEILVDETSAKAKKGNSEDGRKR